jgi:hypothetical protein
MLEALVPNMGSFASTVLVADDWLSFWPSKRVTNRHCFPEFSFISLYGTFVLL